MTVDSIILCPSARLAHSIQNDFAQQQMLAGNTQWQSPQVYTLTQWLDSMIEQGLLTGSVAPESSPYVLSSFNEQLLWEEVITHTLKQNTFGELFDIAGLAAAASEANCYVLAWQLHIPRDQQSEETRQFLHWQRKFQERCRALGALEHVRYMDWQLSRLADGAGELPASIAFAGFDLSAPQETRLREIVAMRGVAVTAYDTLAAEAASTQHVELENEDAECRAAVAWAETRLRQNPQARLAIVTPCLKNVRIQLAYLLDDVFYPLSIRPCHMDMPRHYNFSLGTPLAHEPIIQAALQLLRLITAPQLQQADVTALLLSPFWSASHHEADARALLDAAMREQLPPQFSLSRLIAFIQHQQADGLMLPTLLYNLQAALQIPTGRKQLASAWISTIEMLLDTLGWPGERTINSLEYQAITAWHKALQQLAAIDVLGRKLNVSEVLYHLQQLCASQVFQAETEYQPVIQILGIMEGLSAPVDAIWCMHMNDHLWPPPARPNPLLPASVQREASLPNADNNVQAVFAATIHARLLRSARDIVFSSSRKDGESALRPSPLMQGIRLYDSAIPQAVTLIERLGAPVHDAMEHITDHTAPAIKAGEHVRGGTGLLKAQAICPAWAFYQYRLGARALQTPSTGLDNLERGSLVHGVLEQFWRKRHYADLRDMHAEALVHALTTAVQQTLQAFSVAHPGTSTALLALEAERLLRLVGDWLQYEKAREVSFRIVDCEVAKQVEICGIEVTLRIDRVHALESGALEFIDYKTGQMPLIKSWGEDRIKEPQLPIYATFYAEADQQVAGIHFGMVKTAEHGFFGVSSASFDAAPGKRKPSFIEHFNDWQTLLDHWRAAIERIALELRAGEAAVRFDDESDLLYCDVIPLLRLPERKLQFERFQESCE